MKFDEFHNENVLPDRERVRYYFQERMKLKLTGRTKYLQENHRNNSRFLFNKIVKKSRTKEILEIKKHMEFNKERDFIN